MKSAFIAISILKQSSMLEKTTYNFFHFFYHKKSWENICLLLTSITEKRDYQKNELIEMIIADKPKTIKCSDKDE